MKVMIATDDCYDDGEGYEPDWEDLAYERYKESEFESLLQGHDDLDRGLRDGSGTDRQLRNMNKERNAFARELSREWYFDVTTDIFDVLNGEGDHIATIPREGSPRDGVHRSKFPRPLSRMDKRRSKSNRRAHLRKQFEFLTKRGCIPHQVRGYEDMSSATVVAAV